MPLYDFNCDNCGQTFERYAKMDEKVVDCEACGDGMAFRKITARYSVIKEPDFVTDNISGEPERIDSKKKLRRLLRENDVTEKYGNGWI